MRPAGLFLRDQGSPGSFLRRKGGAAMAYYQYCMVQFREKGTAYAYLTGGVPLEAGAFVIVPVGRYGAKRLGRVTEVFICTEQDAPYPPERTKFVLRRAAETAFPERDAPSKRVSQRDALQESAPQAAQKNAPPGPLDASARKRPAASVGPAATPGIEQSAQACDCQRAEDLAVRAQGAGAVGRTEQAVSEQAVPEEAPQLDRAQAAKPRDLPGVILDTLPGPILDTLPGPILDTLPQPIRLKEPAWKTAASSLSKAAPRAVAQEASGSPQDAGEKAAVPNGAGTPKGWRRWLLLAATLGVFLFVLLRPAPEPKHAEDHELFARWEAEWEAEQQAKKAEIQAMRDAGLPYVGMPESEIGTTPVLGSYGVVQHLLNHNTGWEGRLKRTRYLWFTTGRELIFTAVCLNGYVSEVQEESGYWQDHTLLVPVVKPDTHATYYYNDDDDDSGSLRDEYDSPEDLYEENPDDYEDLDDAWDAWEND